MASLWAPTLDPSPTPVQVALSHGHEEAALACYRAEAAPPAARPSSRGANLAAAEAPSWRDASARGAQVAELYLRGGAGRHGSEPLYPTGYTGHVAQARQAVGQTYGRAIREATNGVAEVAEVGPPWSTLRGPGGGPRSTHALAFSHPDRAAPAPRAHAAAVRVGTLRPPTVSDPNLLRVSTAQMSYPPPEPEAYLRHRARGERTNPSRSRAAPWAESICGL